MGDERTVRIAQSCAADPAAAVEALHDGVRAAGRVARALLLLQRVRPRRARGRDGARGSPACPWSAARPPARSGRSAAATAASTGVSFAPAACAAVIGHLEDLRRFQHPGRASRSRSGLRRRLEDEAPQADAPQHLRLPAGGRPLRATRSSSPTRCSRAWGHPAGRRLGRRQPELRAHVHLPRRPFSRRRGRPRPGLHAAAVHGVQDPALRAHRRAAGRHRGGSRRARRRGDQRPAGRARSTRASSASTRASSTRPTSPPPPSSSSSTARNYVRSIQKANPDGSLKFYCAIERGVVLRVARGVDLVANLETALAQVRAQIGPPQLVLDLRLHPPQAGDRRERARAAGQRRPAAQQRRRLQHLRRAVLRRARQPDADGRRPRLRRAAAAGRPGCLTGSRRAPGTWRPCRPRSPGSTRSSTRSWTARRRA